MAGGDDGFCRCRVRCRPRRPLHANWSGTTTCACGVGCSRFCFPGAQQPWTWEVDRDHLRGLGSPAVPGLGRIPRVAALLRRPEVKYIFRSGTSCELGGKGYGLAQLQAEGLPVPEWFAVSPQGFEDSLNDCQMAALKSGNAHEIHSALEGVVVGPNVLAEISSALRELS